MSRTSNSLSVHTETSQLIDKGCCSVKPNANTIKQQWRALQIKFHDKYQVSDEKVLNAQWVKI